MAEAEWEKVKDVFYNALSRPAGERPGYLDSACGGDAELRAEVETLLDSYESEFLEVPAIASSGELLEQREAPFSVGETIGHYEILKTLGSGGMGSVFLAQDTKLHRLVAIKVIFELTGQGGTAAGRLLREARAAAQLDHPNICPVYEVDEYAGRPFIVMQYVEGVTLEEIIHQGPIPLRRCFEFVREIAFALEAAHSRGVIHRDIKPSNVIVTGRGEGLKVVDFSLAKRMSGFEDEAELSVPGVVAGTTSYMSPEQIRGQAVDTRTDIWSLGVVLYQLLTGALPFRGQTKSDKMAAILKKEYMPVSGYLSGPTGVRIDRIFERLLVKDPEGRYPTIGDLLRDIEDLTDELTGEGIARTSGPAKSRLTVLTEVQPTNERVPADAERARAKTNGAQFEDAGPKPKGRFTSAVVLFAITLLAVAGITVWRAGFGETQARPFMTEPRSKTRVSTILGIKRQIGGALTSLNFSPDGSLLSFALSENGRSSIYIKQPSGGEHKRVTDGKFADQYPVWSPDGQRLAFVSNRGGGWGLWSVSFLGGQPQLLAELEGNAQDYQLKKWRNDGDAIFFSNGSELKEIDVRTGEARTLDLTAIGGTVKRDFAISPDDSQVLAVSVMGDREQIWLASLSSGEARQITDGENNNRAPVWFPDGSRFAYCTDRQGTIQIFVHDMNDSSMRQVTDGRVSSAAAAVSPDGTAIAFASYTDEANVYVNDPETGRETAVTAGVKMNLFPAVAPDGSQIAYQITDDGTKIFASMVRADPAQSSDDEPLTLGQSGCCPKWSPKGDAIAYVRYTGADYHIWRYSVADRTETRLTAEGTARTSYSIAPYDMNGSIFDWSPDGAEIVYASKRTGRQNLWLAAADGSGERMATDLAENSGAMPGLWSPDGRKIAFIMAKGEGPPSTSRDNHLAILEDGEVTIAGSFSSFTRLLGWSQGSDRVYVAESAEGGWDVYFSLIGGDPNRTKAVTLPLAYQNGIRLSPDGKRIAYSERRENVDNILIVPVQGGKPRRVTANTDSAWFYSGLGWTPDGKNLIYSKQTGGIQLAVIYED